MDAQGTTTVWPSGLRRWLQAPVRKGVGSNPTAVMFNITKNMLLVCMDATTYINYEADSGDRTHDRTLTKRTLYH